MGIPYAEVIGDPIAHSKSPLIHKFWLEKLGLEGDYRACLVRPDDLRDYFVSRRRDAKWRGCNVTIPHKIAALSHLDQLESSASRIGAVNCTVPSHSGIIGSNTDVDGIRAAIGDDPWGDVCIFGNGGAARAALWYMAGAYKDRLFGRHYKRSILIVARDREKSARLLAEFGLPGAVHSFSSAAKALSHAALIINASPLGMAGAPQFPKSAIRGLASAYADALVFDMVYNPTDTLLLREAKRKGFHVIDGLTMLIAQAEKCFQLFFGARAPREHDAELREHLSR